MILNFSNNPKDTKIVIDLVSKRHGICFLARAGSRAYGTAHELSDYDYRGIYIPSDSEIWSFTKEIKQFDMSDPDVVIHDIKKFFRLAAKCNPSIIEILFVDPSDIIYASDAGQLIYDNRYNFLSRRAKETFLGYARAQIVKMHKNATSDFKHMMHTVRLVRMGKEILRDTKVNVRRDDAKELLEIRNGAWSEDYLLKWFKDQEAEIEEICAKSTLPESPDEEDLDRLLNSVIFMDHFGGSIKIRFPQLPW